MPHLLVLRHGPTVGPDLLRDPLDQRTGTLGWVEHDLTEDPTVPSLDDVAGLVVLGGQMDVDDDDAWLEPERELLRTAVADRVPTLGICLGAQQLGVALGGAVVHREARHVAVSPLDRTDDGRDDDVVAGWPDGAPALFHHRDEVATLPDGARLLLTGGDGAAPAWTDASGTAHAVQFHPEASTDTVRSWRALVGDEEGGPDEEFLARTEAAAPFLRAAGVGLVMRWVDTRVVPRA